eukprot:14147149-Alexandrium_andersonii.AAC.1
MASPPARAFLKAGFGGMAGVLYFTNAVGGDIPSIMGQDEEGQRFFPPVAYIAHPLVRGEREAARAVPARRGP